MDPTGYPELDALADRLRAVPALDAEAMAAEEVAILGRRQGVLTALTRRLGTLPATERPAFGAAVNRVKEAFEAAFAARGAELADAGGPADGLDLTLPGRARWVGSVHPVNRVVDEILSIFRRLGFAVATGPEAETEETNFLALNFPPDHPAMDMHDTLYLDTGAESPPPGGRVLLRTHTSPVQIHTMRAGPPPYRVVIPGMVYRKDPFDASHAPGFAQIEGLAVDEGIGFVDLKGTLAHFAREFFGAATQVRFRPSYFPFTEPSAEMDIGCGFCGGAGCAPCKGTGWMEILGCGMVHPNVLSGCGVDPDRWTGWAFGMGPARIAMQRFGVPDIRLLYDGDVRFLAQLAEEGR